VDLVGCIYAGWRLASSWRLVHSTAVYGYVVMLGALRPSNARADHLFVGTDRHQYLTCLRLVLPRQQEKRHKTKEQEQKEEETIARHEQYRRRLALEDAVILRKKLRLEVNDMKQAEKDEFLGSLRESDRTATRLKEREAKTDGTRNSPRQY